LETENVSKQYKTNQSFLKILSSIENANINIPVKISCIYVNLFQSYSSVTTKTKINFVKNRLCVKMFRFFLNFCVVCFWKLLRISNLTSWMHQLDSLSHRTRYCWRKSKLFYCPRRRWHKKKHIVVVKSIHSSHCSESKMNSIYSFHIFFL